MKKKKIDVSKLNAVLIVDAIVAAPIPDQVKMEALNDLLKMYRDKRYGDKRCFEGTDWLDFTYPKAYLSGHHVWANSILGHEFWRKLDSIIS